jgi:hypothetical protein
MEPRGCNPRIGGFPPGSTCRVSNVRLVWSRLWSSRVSERRRSGPEIDAFCIRGAASSATLGLALPRTSSNDSPPCLALPRPTTDLDSARMLSKRSNSLKRRVCYPRPGRRRPVRRHRLPCGRLHRPGVRAAGAARRRHGRSPNLRRTARRSLTRCVRRGGSPDPADATRGEKQPHAASRIPTRENVDGASDVRSRYHRISRETSECCLSCLHNG